MTEPRQPGALLPGTLDVLILQAIQTEARHGLGIARRIEQMTDDAFVVKAGSLFPALYRLERAGLVRSKAGESESHRKARFYVLTSAGRAHLREERTAWQRIVESLAHALRSES